MSEQKNNRLVTTGILIIATIGALYFGYQAVYDVPQDNPQNPFEYNIEYFKQSDPSLHHYSEKRSIDLPEKTWRGIYLDRKGKIFVTGNEALMIFDNQGNSRRFPIAGTGYCIALDSNGDIYIGMGTHINIYDASANLKNQIDVPGNRPMTTSLAVTDNHIYVADAGGHIVWEFDRTGKLIKRIGQKDGQRDIPGFIIPSPFFDVAVDPENFLWVANPGRHSLENYTADGGFRSSWGYYSMELAGFCGCCNPTHFAILPDGSFVTSEKGIARVKVYNRIGELISVVAPPAQFDEGTQGLDVAIGPDQEIYVLDPKRKQIRIFQKN